MQFSYNWLQSFFPVRLGRKQKLPKPEELARVLTMHSLEVEEIGKNAKDTLFNIDILSNRTHDCLSYMGMAREIHALLGMNLSVPVVKYAALERLIKIKRSARGLRVRVDDKNLCSRYIGVLMSGVKVGPSPAWIKERLGALEQRSINNIVDITNFVMLEMGQPLHAFDADKVDGGIIVRRARDGEKMTTLDDEEVVLNKNILIIADSKAPLAIAGIKGGKKAQITETTKNIILESANFDGPSVRRASRAVGIATDSSLRFAAGLDPNLAGEAMARVMDVVRTVSGGRAVAASDIYPKKLSAVKISLDADKLNAVLGARIDIALAKKILERLGCEVKMKQKKVLLVTPPTRRLDLSIEEDLIEEVGRVYGYENITSRAALIEMALPSRDDAVHYRARMRDLLCGMGFFEAYNYSFVGESDLELIGLPTGRAGASSGKNIFKLVNPTRPEFAFLRPSLMFGLLKNLKENLKHAKDVRFFEMGHVFYKKESDSMALSIASSEWKESKEAFLELKGALIAALESFGVADVWFDDAPESVSEYDGGGNLLHPFQRSEIKIGDKVLGIIGSVHPDTAASYKLKGKAAVCELDFRLLIDFLQKENEYMPVSKFPAVVRDLALLVPRDVRMSEVSDMIENSGGILLKDADLFDVYEGEEFEGRKSFAFHLIFQSDERTLSDSEADKIMENIITALEGNVGWEARR
ncbi:MAG: phenylalanine--tRNA ligase subunit beta [Patescibacteria group bacterium]